MQYTTILFDLDGTLLDSVPLILRCFCETHEKLGLPYDEHAIRCEIGRPLTIQSVMFADERSPEFLDHYTRIYRAYQQEAGARLFPGTIEMLEELRRREYRLGLVTSKSTRGVEIVLEQTGLSGLFDHLVTANDCTDHKPHPEPILKALGAFQVPPEQALYVGDSSFDIDASRAAGVDVVVMSWGARSREDLLVRCPGRVFDEWSQFLSWLSLP